MINSIKNYQAIGIIGIAKNSGKTTTLNALIKAYHHEKLGLTSIGLDGESLDQVNFLPKPKIECYPDMVIATAKTCLDVSLADFIILEETPFLTALGRVYIIQIKKQGTIMLAGPTTNDEMNQLLMMMKKYVDRLFVDGALSRKTFSAMAELDGIVLATGASFSPVMEETIAKTKQVIDTFAYPKTQIELNTQHAMIIAGRHKKVVLSSKSAVDLKDQLSMMKNQLVWIYVKGALTERLLHMFIDLRLKGFKLICEDPSKLLIHHHQADVFSKLDIEVEVIKTSPLILITVNPYRPTGDSYDANQFKSHIMKLTHVTIIDVKEEVNQDGK